MYIKDAPNNQRIRLEKELKDFKHVHTLKHVTAYLKLLKDTQFTRLIQEQQNKDDILILTGELKAIQKLLDVMELRDGTVGSADDILSI